MSYKIKLLSIAHTDLKKAKKWYLDKNPLLAEEFKAEVNNEIDYIGKYPEHYQTLNQGRHFTFLKTVFLGFKISFLSHTNLSILNWN